MSLITDNPFARTLTATAVAAALALSLGTAYAADTKTEAPAKPATEQAQTPGKTPEKAQGQQVTERETAAEYIGWEDPDMARVAVHGGRSLLRQVQAAHTALEENKIGESRSALSAAEDSAEGLQLMMPYTVVVDHIRNAKHELLASTAGVIVDDMLPIYSSLDEMSAYAPELAAKAKTKLDEATEHVKKGEKKEAAKKMDEVATEISSTTVYLPVLYVEHQVEAARHALDKDPADTKTAKSAVDNALESLVHATVNMHFLPQGQASAKSTPPSDKQAAAQPDAGGHKS